MSERIGGVSRFSTWMHRNKHRVDWGFFALGSALLLFSIADAAGVLPGERGWRPRASVIFGMGFLLQPTASLVGRRSRALQMALLVLSCVLMFGSLYVRS